MYDRISVVHTAGPCVCSCLLTVWQKILKISSFSDCLVCLYRWYRFNNGYKLGGLYHPHHHHNYKTTHRNRSERGRCSSLCLLQNNRFFAHRYISSYLLFAEEDFIENFTTTIPIIILHINVFFSFHIIFLPALSFSIPFIPFHIISTLHRVSYWPQKLTKYFIL